MPPRKAVGHTWVADIAGEEPVGKADIAAGTGLVVVQTGKAVVDMAVALEPADTVAVAGKAVGRM